MLNWLRRMARFLSGKALEDAMALNQAALERILYKLERLEGLWGPDGADSVSYATDEAIFDAEQTAQERLERLRWAGFDVTDEIMERKGRK